MGFDEKNWKLSCFIDRKFLAEEGSHATTLSATSILRELKEGSAIVIKNK